MRLSRIDVEVLAVSSHSRLRSPARQRSAASPEGKIYCEYGAPDEDAIREHARQAGLPADSISELALEISLAMFR